MQIFLREMAKKPSSFRRRGRLSGGLYRTVCSVCSSAQIPGDLFRRVHIHLTVGVNIDVHCSLDFGVSQTSRYNFNRDAHFQEHRCVHMPQIMESDRTQIILIQHVPEL